MSLSAVLPSVLAKCPKCHSARVRRSSWHRKDGHVLPLMFSPYRCVDCDKRFLRLSQRFGSIIGISALALTVISIVLVIIYFLNLDGIAPPPPKKPLAPLAGKGTGPEALEPYARAAAGDVQSQFEMGMLYLSGEGGAKKSYGEALKWLELAGKGGHAEARFNLGYMYKTGLGALQNFEQALQWFELAAGQNHAEAQFNVALMYKMGMSVPADYVKAYTWANIGAVQGHLGAINLRDNLLGAMTPQQIAEGQRASREWKPNDGKPVTAAPPTTEAKG